MLQPTKIHGGKNNVTVMSGVSSVNVRGDIYVISHVSYVNRNTWSEEQLILAKVNDFNILTSVTNSQGSISRWKFNTLKVQYTTLDYTRRIF
jgi:hypothetical protein